MPIQKRPRLVKDGGRIKQHKELVAAHQEIRKTLLSLAASVERNTDLKLELMKLRGY